MSHPLPIQAILFDLDGTLIDTEPSAALAVQVAFGKWGMSLHPKDAHYVTGRTWDSAFEYLFEKYHLPISRTEATQIILESYRETLSSQLIVVPGAVSAIEQLAREYPLALVSGSHRREILWSLKKLGIFEHFQVVLGAEDYPRSKPAPDGYALAIRNLGVKAENCAVFEDSEAGIASARAAGVGRVIAITGTNHHAQNISTADRSISDLTPVSPDWIREL